MRVDFERIEAAKDSSISTKPSGVSHCPAAMRETGAPRPVWFGPMSTKVSGSSIREYTAPATDPEYIKPAWGDMMPRAFVFATPGTMNSRTCFISASGEPL